MNSRQTLAIGAGAVLVSLGIFLLRNQEAVPPAHSHSEQPPKRSAAPNLPSPGTAASPEASPAAPARASLEGQPALAAPQPSDLVATETPPLADRIGSPHTPQEQEAKVVLDLLKLYRRLLGAYPAGENNAQFVNALLGANKEKLPLLTRNHPRLNPKGELIDAWGTPFFFHQNSRTSVEVRSAGADRLLFTGDDIVAGRRSVSPDPSPALDESAVN